MGCFRSGSEGALVVKFFDDLTNNTGWPRKNGTVDTVDFQDFALINSYFLHFFG